MKPLLVAFAFLFTTNLALAYNLHVTEVERPYDVVPVTMTGEQQVYLGSLTDFPVMYEIELADTKTLELELKQKYNRQSEPLQLSLLLVKEDADGRGVSEILRFKPQPEDWSVEKDSRIGMTFLTSPTVEEELAAGTYRVEISTADNQGKYALVLGEDTGSAGYFTSLGQAYTTQTFFGYSPLRLLTSSLVYYPLGIIFIAFIINRVLKYRKTIKNVE